MFKNKVHFLVTLATYLTKRKNPVIYIAGKITGLQVEDFQAKFKAAQDKLEAAGFTVLNPCQHIAPESDWQVAMRMAQPLLCMADSICMLPDWQDSPGAKMEFDTAIRLGLDVMYD